MLLHSVMFNISEEKDRHSDRPLQAVRTCCTSSRCLSRGQIARIIAVFLLMGELLVRSGHRLGSQLGMGHGNRRSVTQD